MPYGVATQGGGAAVTQKQKRGAAEAFRRDMPKPKEARGAGGSGRQK